MREDETVTDASDEFEVYERKRPRPEAQPGTSPDASHAPTPASPHAAEHTPLDASDGAWLLAPPDDAAATPSDQARETTPTDERRGASLLDRLRGDLAAAPEPAVVDESPLSLFDASMLPDPPAEPMRVPPPAEGRADPFPQRTSASGWASASTPTPYHAAPTLRSAAPPPSSAPHVPSRTSSPRQGGDTMRIAIAATEFNYDITHMMVERARSHAEFLGAEITHVVRVPGVYDLPLAVKRLLARSDVDGVATLGVVIEGETDHDDLVIQHAARKIVDLSLEHDKPVGLGITGPGMSRLQAEARIDRAKDAVEAIVKLQRSLSGL